MHEFMAPNNVDARVAATIRGGGNGEIYAPRARSIPTPRDSRNKKFNVSFIAWQMLNLPGYRHSRMHPLSLYIYIYSNINVYMRLMSIIVYDYYINFYAERRKDLSVKIHSNSNCSSIYIFFIREYWERIIDTLDCPLLLPSEPPIEILNEKQISTSTNSILSDS